MPRFERATLRGRGARPTGGAGATHADGTATTVAIGDRLSTDIEGAARAGIASILVMTGVTTPEKLANSAVRPTLIYRGLPELTAAITGAGE